MKHAAYPHVARIRDLKTKLAARWKRRIDEANALAGEQGKRLRREARMFLNQIQACDDYLARFSAPSTGGPAR